MVGPELSGIGRQMNRKRILESILQPSREIAPMYVPFVILSRDGRAHQGLKTQGGAKTNTFLGSDGKEFQLALDAIELQRPSKVSIMPDGLQQRLTVTQLRALLSLRRE